MITISIDEATDCARNEARTWGAAYAAARREIVEATKEARIHDDDRKAFALSMNWACVDIADRALERVTTEVHCGGQG